MISGAEEVRKINSIVSQKIEKIIDRFNLRMFKVRYEVSTPKTIQYPLERYSPKPRRIFDKVVGFFNNSYGEVTNGELIDYADEIHFLLSIEREVNALCDYGFTSVEDAYFS